MNELQPSEFAAWFQTAYPLDQSGGRPAYREAGVMELMRAAWNAGHEAGQAKPTVPDHMQDWAGMDGAIAFHLIERHSDSWADIGKMMAEWLAANQGERIPVQRGG